MKPNQKDLTCTSTLSTALLQYGDDCIKAIQDDRLLPVPDDKPCCLVWCETPLSTILNALTIQAPLRQLHVIAHELNHYRPGNIITTSKLISIIRVSFSDTTYLVCETKNTRYVIIPTPQPKDVIL